MSQIIELSYELLKQVKHNKEYSTLVARFSKMPFSTITELDTDNKKKTFWINIYNAYFLILRRDEKVPKSKIYKQKLLQICSKKMSLDDVEHGILRKYRYKYSLGFITNYFTNAWIKKNAVKELDFRIHFALNCGAKSCPPIAFYSLEKLDYQLKMATGVFIEQETRIDEGSKTVHLSRLFLWYKADFGNGKEVNDIIQKHLQKDIIDYRIKYSEYNWEEDLSNFA